MSQTSLKWLRGGRYSEIVEDSVRLRSLQSAHRTNLELAQLKKLLVVISGSVTIPSLTMR